MSEMNTDAGMWDYASSLKLQVFIPHDNELFLDFDEPAFLNRRNEAIINRYYDTSRRLWTTSKSGYNKHLYIKMPANVQLDIKDRIILEMALGSDPVRGLLALTVAKGLLSRRTALTLFEIPDEAKKVIKFLGREPDREEEASVADDSDE